MKHAMLAMAVIFGAAGCATVEAEETSAEVEAKLAEFERTGDMRSCLNLRSIDQIKPLNENLFLVRVGVNDYYLNEVSGRCSGADSSFNRLQYTTSLNQLCRNEIIRVVDNSTGFTIGSCGLGSFERLEKKPKEDTDAES